MPLASLLRAFRSKKAGDRALPVRIAVVGAGRMGQFHLKALSKLPQAKLVGVSDVSPERMAGAAKKYRLLVAGSVEELAPRLDAVVIAAPTPAHYALGKSFLEAGVSCLIEKPFTETLEQADELIRLARRKNC